MSNAFRGQTQYQQSPMMGYGGYGVGGLGGNSYAQLGGSAGGYGGGYGSPFSSSIGGGYGTTFGGYDMGGGYGGGYSQPSLVPQYQPTINDAFSRYFSQQYYGGDAFNPFAATSLFGGGYGGGFGGGRRGGMGGRMRRRRQMFEDLFGPQQPVAQPPQSGTIRNEFDQFVQAPAASNPQDLMMYAGGSPGFYSQQQPIVSEPAISQMPQNFPMMPDMAQFFQPQQSLQPTMQPYQPTYEVAPMTEEDRIRARAAIRSGAFSAL